MTRRLSVEVRPLAGTRLVAVVATELSRGRRMAWGRRAPLLLLVGGGRSRQAFTPDGTGIAVVEIERRFPEAARALRDSGEDV